MALEGKLLGRGVWLMAGALSLLLLASRPLMSQKVQTSLAPAEIRIGEPSRLTFELEIPAGSAIVWPAISDTISADIEILRFGRPDTISHNKSSLVIQQVHTITAWEAGLFPVPPMVFPFIEDGDTLVIESQPVLLEVRGSDIDTGSAIKDIKGIVPMPVGLAELLPYILGLLVLAGLSWGLIRHFGQRKKPEKEHPVWVQPDIPAHMAALSGLEGLRSKKLWQGGKVKQHHSELSDILRQYLERRYLLNALEMTTSEILAALPGALQQEEAGESLREILELADLVKFAKFRPEPHASESSLNAAFAFVEQTKERTGHAG